jgi:hypothetical protein|tara:strand:+ start:1059 stop:1388 length:330 start_codon:yes stop_codon:yes gene_type:complete
MAFKPKRKRKANKKSVLLKRLKELKAKKSLTKAEEAEIDRILVALDKKRTNKIETKKLNNNKQNETISINININNNTGEPTRDINWSTPDHYASAAGTYRKSRIDNRKY